MDIKKPRKILVLGSGMMVEPLIDYLLKREENSIALASDILEAAQTISSRKIRCYPERVDVVKETEKLASLVKDSDLVISFIPAFLHLHVAKQCLAYSKSMVTASYISEDMKALDSEVKAKNLVFMNEIGLDPGIDHIVTHKVIDECQAEGSKIISYESWCGALPSPDAIDNPLLYKFSWSPRGALNALKNSVVFLQDGKEKEIPEERVLLSTVNKPFHPCFNFEGYYNRNSVKYRDVYHLHDAETIIRGTIRFKGFSFIVQCFKYLGLFDSVDVIQSELHWRTYLNTQIEKEITKIQLIQSKYDASFKLNIPDLSEDDVKLYRNLAFFAISNLPLDYINDEILVLTNSFIEMVHYLGLTNSTLLMRPSKTKLDNFAEILEDKLKLQLWEKDLVFMQNTFTVLRKDGKKLRKNYNLVLFGNHNNLPYSATSLTVAYPAAIAAQMILDGEIKDYGVLMPSNPNLCKKVIEELAKNKIFMREEVRYC